MVLNAVKKLIKVVYGCAFCFICVLRLILQACQIKLKLSVYDVFVNE